MRPVREYLRPMRVLIRRASVGVGVVDPKVESVRRGPGVYDGADFRGAFADVLDVLHDPLVDERVLGLEIHEHGDRLAVVRGGDELVVVNRRDEHVPSDALRLPPAEVLDDALAEPPPREQPVVVAGEVPGEEEPFHGVADAPQTAVQGHRLPLSLEEIGVVPAYRGDERGQREA